MDPDANLAEQREIIDRLLKGKAGASSWIRDVGALVERTQALDAWLANGGFLPKAWGRARS